MEVTEIMNMRINIVHGIMEQMLIHMEPMDKVDME